MVNNHRHYTGARNHLFVKLTPPLFYHNLLFPFLYVRETFFLPILLGVKNLEVWFTTSYFPLFFTVGIVPANKLLGSTINSFPLLCIAIMIGLGVWKDASYKWRPCSWCIFSMYAQTAWLIKSFFLLSWFWCSLICVLRAKMPNKKKQRQ